ncbi:hypothetical protein J4212_04655 [Candidatus Woesearchaeota archaeon]|nr:hypothetical protein [Candidatus Woesearchaeota archaeon]
MTLSGEGMKLLEQVREISKDLLEDLSEIDSRLAELIEDIKLHEEIDKEKLLNALTEIRTSIGAMEKEDSEELEDEQILENMIKKLNNLIEMTLG